MAHRTRTARRLLAGASLIIIGALGAGAAFAEDAADQPVSVSGISVNGEVIKTAPPVPPLKATFTQSTITNEAVRNLSPAPVITLQTMLANQPSIFVYANGPLGVGTNINFRAFNSGEFAETYDGVALNDAFNSSVTGQADVQNNVLFLPSNVDSVQIYRGINNPSVNSYNSLGGTIDFLPRQPDKYAGGLVGGSYGSFNSQEAHVAINTGEIAGLRQLVTFSEASSDGWADNTSDRNTNVFYSGQYAPTSTQEVNLYAAYNNNVGHTPFEMPLALVDSDHYFQWPSSVAYENDRDQSWMTILDWRWQIAPNIKVTNKFFGGADTYNRTSYANPNDSEIATQPYELPSAAENYNYWIYNPNGPTYNPKAVFGSDTAGNDYHAYMYHTWAVGYSPSVAFDLPHNLVTVGGNVTYGQLQSAEFWYGKYDMPTIQGYNDAWDEHDIRTLASVYAQDEISLLDNRLTVIPGVKYLWAQTSDHDAVAIFYPYGGQNSSTASFVAPTIGLNYKITPEIAAYFAFGENIRFPDITAYYNGIPGTTAATPPKTPPVTVKPEHVNDFELGVRYQGAGGLSGSVSVYREDFTDTFVDTFHPDTYLTTVTNGGGSRYQGIEVELQDDFGLQAWGDVKSKLSFAYNDAYYTSAFSSDSVGGGLSNADTEVYKGEAVGGVPNYLVSWQVNWNYQGWRADLAVRYVGPQFADATSIGLYNDYKIGGYTVVDLGVSDTIPLNGVTHYAKSIKLGVYANNLFNAFYINEAYAEPAKYNYKYVPYLEGNVGAPASVTGRIELAF